jgi:hypothetical protein
VFWLPKPQRLMERSHFLSIQVEAKV